MKKICTLFVVVLLVFITASTVFAGEELIFGDAGVKMQIPGGFRAVEYNTETSGQFAEQLEEYELSDIVKSAHSLPLGYAFTAGFPDIDDYVVIDDGRAYVAYIAAYEDDISKGLWSFSELGRGVMAETLNSLQAGGATVDLYENDYAFVSIRESGKMTGNYQIASYEAVENGYNIIIVVSSLHGDPLAVGREIADSVVITPKVSGAYIAGWVFAIIVSAILAILFMRQKKKPAEIRRTEYEKLQGYGWVVILVTVCLFINVAVLIVNLVGDYSIYDSSTAATILAINISGLALRILLLLAIFKKSKFFVPLYVITMIFVFIGNAALKSYPGMAFSVIDVAVCIYLLYSKRIAVIFKLRETRIIEDRMDYAGSASETGVGPGKYREKG